MAFEGVLSGEQVGIYSFIGHNFVGWNNCALILLEYHL